MAHNKDRHPTYPTENKKLNTKSVIALFKNGWSWLCFALVVIFVIFIVYKISHNAIRSNDIEKNSVTTEAVITQIGESSRWVGAPVYYDFFVGDSLYHGVVYASRKTRDANSLVVGQTITITYEKCNPSNSMFGGTLSQ